jgi:hypothetical protein
MFGSRKSLVILRGNGMGSPNHYSLELPIRCLDLLDALWPHAQEVYPQHRKDLGPLTATFLLSMAMPIINLPIERIERRVSARVEGYVADHEQDAALTRRMQERLGAKPIRNAPFFVHGDWSYYEAMVEAPLNIAFGFPDEIAQRLRDPAAVNAASALRGNQWTSVLRNSLAHGGIAYLDQAGNTARESPTHFLAFVSGSFDHDECGRPVRLKAVRTLRISMKDFRSFLHAWVHWLNTEEGGK